MLRRLCLAPALAFLAAAAATGCGSEPAGPHVVLVTLESLRTDYLGVYGGASPTRPELPVMPALEAFASGATVYSDAHAVTSWTLASHASLFTGLYPGAHQTQGPRDRLHESYPTLAEALAERGWETAGVVSGPYLRRRHNLNQGFERWSDEIAAPVNAVAHADVTNPQMLAALEATLAERDPGRPLFLFAYFWDPHFDFEPPAPYDSLFVCDACEPLDASRFDTNPAVHPYMKPERLDWVRAQYAGELRATDEALARLFAMLRERGLWEDALIIVTADHGEEFFDHGEKGHKKNLHAEAVRVPLIVKYPGQREGRRDARLVSLVDVLPTVLALAGGPPAFEVQGRSLLAAEDPARAIFFELLASWYVQRPEGVEARERRFFGVRQGARKLLWNESDEATTPELYAVDVDPGERADRAASEPERAAELRRVFEAGARESRRLAAGYEAGGAAELGADERAQLCELGYLREGC